MKMGFSCMGVLALLILSRGACAQTNNNLIINVLHISDHHSHLVEETLNVKNAGVSGLAQKVLYGGFPRIKQLMVQGTSSFENVIKIHAGDALVGTGFYHLFGTAPDVAMMHQVCFDVFNIGNHEFDDGDAVLAGFIQKLTDPK
jgi:5'-nucleotidase / UDP-sugar diphosphatase